MKEINGVKIQITDEMIGQDCIILSEKEWYQDLEYGELNLFHYNSKISNVSLRQNNLYWSCCKLVANNKNDDNFNTKEKVSDQCKINARHAKGFFTWVNTKGIKCVQLILKSLKFKEFKEKDKRNEYFEKSFAFMSDLLGITPEELIEQAKSEMKQKDICLLCGKPAKQRHHMFSQSKPNREKYGNKIIDSPFNIKWFCHDCHSSHENPEVHKYTLNERQFNNLLLTQDNVYDLLKTIPDDNKRDELFSRMGNREEMLKNKFKGDRIK